MANIFIYSNLDLTRSMLIIFDINKKKINQWVIRWVKLIPGHRFVRRSVKLARPHFYFMRFSECIVDSITIIYKYIAEKLTSCVIIVRIRVEDMYTYLLILVTLVYT